MNFISWLEKRIQENLKRIDVLNGVKCRVSANFINDAKNLKLMLNLIAFLKKAVRNSSEVINI